VAQRSHNKGENIVCVTFQNGNFARAFVLKRKFCPEESVRNMNRSCYACATLRWHNKGALRLLNERNILYFFFFLTPLKVYFPLRQTMKIATTNKKKNFDFDFKPLRAVRF
jgi:predicted dithiol-disulfide oxidoreductase (DUF899 family)